MLTFHRRPARALRPAASVQRHRGRLFISGISVATVGSTLGARLAATFLSFVAGIIAARELGEHGRGVLALLIAVPAAFSVLGVVGLDTANLRFAGRSHTAFLRIIRVAVMFSLLAGTAASAAWLLASAWWPAVRLGLSPELALLCALLCPITVLLTLLGAAEVGRGRIQVLNIVTAGAVAAYLVAIAVLAASDQLTVIRCFVSYAASQIVSVIVLLLTTGRRVQEVGEKVPFREYSGYSLRAYLPNIAQYGMLRMDVPVIQVLAGTNAVALYAVALPFAEAMLLLPIAVSLVMFPQVTSGTLSRKATGDISAAVFAGTAVLAGVAALIVPIAVPLIYGSAFRGSVLVIWCMLPGVVIFGAGRTVQTYLAATDRLGPVILAAGAGIVVGLVSLVTLSPRFGAAGAGAADSVGYFAYAAVILRWVRRNGPLAIAAAKAISYCRQAGATTGATMGGATGVSRLTIFGCVAAAAGALVAALLSTASTPTLIDILAILLVLIAVAWPTAGLYMLAIAIPVTQTPRGAAVISVRDLLVLVIACLIGQMAVSSLAKPRTFIAATAAAGVSYFLVSAVLVGGQGATSKDLLNIAELSIPLLCLPLIVRTGTVARRAAIVFSFSTACLAVAEVGHLPRIRRRSRRCLRCYQRCHRGWPDRRCGSQRRRRAVRPRRVRAPCQVSPHSPWHWQASNCSGDHCAGSRRGLLLQPGVVLWDSCRICRLCDASADLRFCQHGDTRRPPAVPGTFRDHCPDRHHLAGQQPGRVLRGTTRLVGQRSSHVHPPAGPRGRVLAFRWTAADLLQQHRQRCHARPPTVRSRLCP